MATSLDHLFLRETATSSPFKSPRPGGSPKLPTPNRDTHSRRLLRQLARLRRDEERIKRRREEEGRPLDAGMKVAISLALVGAIAGEFVASQVGLGYVILTAQGMFQISRVFAAVTLLGVLGTILFYLVGLVERLVMPWHVSQRSTAQASY